MQKFFLEAPGTLPPINKVEAIHTASLDDRNGYDRDFLKTTVELPVLVNPDLIPCIAVNQQAKRNKNYLDYTNYSVMFNKDAKLPFVSAVNILGDENELALAHEERTSDSWLQDNRIKEKSNSFQFSNADYAKSGFQKGHMVRYYDPAWGATDELRKIAMGDTFYYTNCCPQLASFNGGVWNDLEDYYMSRAIFQDYRVSVFSGPIFNKAQIIGRLLVPVNYWKVVVYTENDQVKALGFIISHELAFEKLVQEKLLVAQKLVQPSLKKTDIDRLFNVRNLKKWVVRIKLIEEKTGLNFNLSKKDVNKNRPKYFNKTPAEFNRNVAKAGFTTNTIGTAITNDTEFIKNI